MKTGLEKKYMELLAKRYVNEKSVCTEIIAKGIIKRYKTTV